MDYLFQVFFWTVLLLAPYLGKCLNCKAILMPTSGIRHCGHTNIWHNYGIVVVLLYVQFVGVTLIHYLLPLCQPIDLQLPCYKYIYIMYVYNYNTYICTCSC